ncbi:hypothetical protein PMI16_00823 [Herbaspirillum sp. CF444]|uniref:hypothetical protein n=1 Tax=Herbaspirillum sp. CF444 TaxID=1144319 RepID=UPI0002724B88|nr:hypothetical protein [Herbaspirillum sp. CF444]EJL92671.1 hypothetical protein PMI16_00823 [Herbaspirillum sp. CF444]
MYTVVDEGYNVDLYRSMKAVTEAMADAKLYFDDIEEEIAAAEPATAKQIIAKALRKEPIVRLVEEPGDRDGKYRIEKH